MASLMVQLRPFAMIMKRKGESGSPCLMPLVGEKGLEGTPLIRMENKADEVRLIIQEIQLGSKPKARRVDFKYLQLNLSKDFERCSFRIIPRDFVEWSEWITSCAKSTLSKIFLSSKYLDCSCEIMNGKMGLRRVAMIFVRSL